MAVKSLTSDLAMSKGETELRTTDKNGPFYQENYGPLIIPRHRSADTQSVPGGQGNLSCPRNIRAKPSTPRGNGYASSRPPTYLPEPILDHGRTTLNRKTRLCPTLSGVRSAVMTQ